MPSNNTTSSSSSTLVNLADNVEVRIVTWLAEQTEHALNVDQCHQYIASSNGAGLVQVILQTPRVWDTLVVQEDVETCQSVLALICAIFKQSTNLSSDIVVNAILKAAGNDNDNNKDRKLILLSTLYNMQTKGMEKVYILTAMMGLVTTSTTSTSMQQLTSWVQPADNNNNKIILVELLEQWKISMPDRRPLYKAVVDNTVFSATTRQRFRLLYLETFSQEDLTSKTTDTVQQQMAVDAAVAAIQDPFGLPELSVLELPAVAALQHSSNANDAVYNLLHSLHTDTWQHYQGQVDTWWKDLPANHGLDRNAVDASMRMWAIGRLAAQAPNGQLQYADIATALDISVSDIEGWIIQATQVGMLQAKLDQLGQVVVVQSVAGVVPAWTQWQSKLHTWKAHVESILTVVQEQQQQQKVPAAAGV